MKAAQRAMARNKIEKGNVYESFCLNPRFSTTRCVTHAQPLIVNHPNAMFETQLLPKHSLGRLCEGGLRSQGYFKFGGHFDQDTEEIHTDPLVTIITVVFNDAAHLEETISSVLSQRYNNVEYIIIDGGSMDGTLDIIRKYEHAIDYFVSEPDEGISDAFNKGIKLSSGKWINFLNSGDNYVNRDVIAKIIEHANGQSIITAFSKYGENKTIPKRKWGNVDQLHLKSRISHQASFVNHYVFDDVGLFDTNYSIRMDYEFWLRALRKYDFHYLNDIIVNYSAGISKTEIRKFHYEEIRANVQHIRRSNYINLLVLIRYLIKKYLLRR